jgi:hypothetical protein
MLALGEPRSGWLFTGALRLFVIFMAPRSGWRPPGDRVLPGAGRLVAGRPRNEEHVADVGRGGGAVLRLMSWASAVRKSIPYLFLMWPAWRGRS